MIYVTGFASGNFEKILGAGHEQLLTRFPTNLGDDGLVKIGQNK